MMTETYDQIVKREKDAEARKQRAWEIDKITQSRDRAKAQIERIEQTLSTPDRGIEALNSILTLLLDVPEGIQTPSSRFMPGGYDTRELVTAIIENARRHLELKRERLEEQLPVARQTLEQCEKTLNS